MHARIVITGMGVCSSIGNTLEQFAENLRSGRPGIREYAGLFPDKSVWAGLVDGVAEKPGVDRAALLARRAAEAAWRQAEAATGTDMSRVALLLGTSHGGRSQMDACLEEEAGLEGASAAAKILHLSPHYRQTEWVASQLGIHGVVSTVSTACSSGSAAILHALDLLRAGHCDYALAGGMDGFAKLTHAGFHSLGAVSDGACGPFSERLGISLGEGAGVLALERLEHAQERGAAIWAELYGAGSSWDCYHLTEPHPCGDGLLRALEMAAAQSGLPNGAGLEYAHLHGTGTRANDGAETIALKRFFDDAPPPASSVKSFTGHTLGASGAIGLIACILGMKHGFLPPTVNFGGARAGCDLDYVPNQARPSGFQTFSAQSAGFGGANLVLMGGRLRPPATPPSDALPSVAISGIGIVSAAGTGMKAFRQSLQDGATGIAPNERFESARQAGLVRDFFPRKLAPTLSLRRADLCFQYAAIAVAEALAEAGIAARGIAPERIGLLAGTTRGAVASFESCLRSAAGGMWQQTSALHFPNLVMSSLGGYVSNMFQLRGSASTIVCGPGGGLQALAHGFEALRRNPLQDALVVVLADEISPLFDRYHDELHAATEGAAMGEGAAAFVLERRPPAGSGVWINGCAFSADSQAEGGIDSDGAWLEHCLRTAMNNAGIHAKQVNLAMRHGHNCRCRDARELSALERLFGNDVPLQCVLPNTGFAESTSAGFAVAAAALSLREQEADSSHAIENVLALSSSDSGNNCALVLGRQERAPGL